MQEKTDNIALIIIDQLRADYFRLFKECSRLLPYKAVVDTNSMPTSTEAMHANMSTGEYPATHGFISKETREGERGLQQIVGKIESKEIPFSH